MGRTKGQVDSRKRKGHKCTSSQKTSISNGMKRAHDKRRNEERAKNKSIWNGYLAQQPQNNDKSTTANSNTCSEDAAISANDLSRDDLDEDNEPVHYKGWESQFNPGPIDCELDADEEGHTSDDEGDYEYEHSSGHCDAGNEAESANINGSARSTMQIYSKHIQIRLQSETASQGRNVLPALEKKWLIAYLQAHDWWIRRYDAKSICKQLGIDFQDGSYYRDVKIWLPDVQWGKDCTPVCPNCDTNCNVSFHAWRSNHYGRKIIGMKENYFTLSRRYKCSKCYEDHIKWKSDIQRVATEQGARIEFVGDEQAQSKNYTFMAWNSRSLQMMPYSYGEKFPAVLSHRSGLDKLVVDLMRPLFDKGVRPEALSNVLLELHSKQYTTYFIEREQALQKSRTGMGAGGNAAINNEMFSEFSDKAKYDGTVPTGRYLTQMYKKIHNKIKRFLELEVKKRTSTRLHFDVS